MADLQIGMQPDGRKERAEDFIEAAVWAGQRAKNNPDCVSVVVAGDMRETVPMPGDQFSWLMDILDACGDKPMGLLMGNHDMSNPNWVETASRRIKGIFDFATPEGMKACGFNPDTTFASHYVNPTILEEKLKPKIQKGTLKTVVLHQSIGEFGAARFADITAQLMSEWMPEVSENLKVFAGDIHNWGDCSFLDGRLEAFSPGSLQMTDVNEGFNGFRSDRYGKNTDNDGKFIIWYDLDTQEITRERVPDNVLRPWAYLKLEEGSAGIPDILHNLTRQWEGRKPGIVELKVPAKDITPARKLVEENPGLAAGFDDCRIRHLPDKKTEEKLEELASGAAPEELAVRQGWVKGEILKLAKERVETGMMSQEAVDLLEVLCKQEGPGKVYVSNAIHEWSKGMLVFDQDPGSDTDTDPDEATDPTDLSLQA